MAQLPGLIAIIRLRNEIRVDETTEPKQSEEHEHFARNNTVCHFQLLSLLMEKERYKDEVSGKLGEEEMEGINVACLFLSSP